MRKVRRNKFNDFKDRPLGYNIELDHGGHRTCIMVKPEYWKRIKETNSSASLIIDQALKGYYKNQWISRIDMYIMELYREILLLEKFKEIGSFGDHQFTILHQLQIESYKEVIRILENSPLLEKRNP